MNTVTVAEMKEIEKIADAAGLSYYQMMENAGSGSYEIIRSRFPDIDSVVVFCGKGNNGGDGLVVARLAANDGMRVCVVMVEGKPVTADARTNFEKLPETVKVTEVNGVNGLSYVNRKMAGSCASSYVNRNEPADDVSSYVNPQAVIVDALYGTGFHGELRENGRLACDLMNSLGVPVVSLDIPSGCNADDRSACEGAVTADVTIVFHAYKNVHFPPVKNCGECVRVGIGIGPFDHP